MVIAPEVGGYTPEMILISVDLPAPLSPTSATISPRIDIEREILDGDDAVELLADVL